MKRMKGVAAAAAAALEPSPSAYSTVFEDPRTRLRHQSLLQDYDELLKETEVQRKRLHIMKQKKLTLSAEVRFLRQRYKYLMQNHSQNAAPEPKHVQRKSMVNGTKAGRKDRNYAGNDSAVQRAALQIDLNRKGKIYSEREAILQNPVPNFDLGQKQKTYMAKEPGLRNSTTIPDLNQKQRIYSGKEAAVRTNTPIFDLNQISREEEELQANGEMMRVEEPKLSLMRGGNDEQHNEMKLSACRTVGNGSSRAGKRKISWQDQVALRV